MRLRQLIRFANILAAVIFIFVPFTALLTTWGGSNFGHLDLFRIWKELLLIPLGVISLGLLIGDRTVRTRVGRSWLLWLTLAYLLLSIILGLMAHHAGRVNSSALIYGLLENLRFVSFMMFCWIISIKNDWLYRHWRELLLGPALIVLAFAILQWLVLPSDFLRHFGYGLTTIPAVQTVDQQASYQRLQSTLRGANPLGAYLVIILTGLGAMFINNKQRRSTGAFLVGSAAIVLFLTYSRSAYLGVIVSVGLLLWWLLPQAWPKIAWHKYISLSAVGLVIVGSLLVIGFRHNTQVEDIVFHSSQQSRSTTSSNAKRTSALQGGLKDVRAHPWGQGPGTAGPASTRNNHPPKIAENYYVQIAQEVGLPGLALFVAINVLAAVQLWRRRSLLSAILLASLIGLTLVNMISHAWADDTLGLLWWGMAGIALAQPAILNKRQTANGKKTATKKIKTS